jgi:hypothetical protein
MLDAKKVWLFGRLKHSLQLLASQAEIQFRELPTFCNKSDELFISCSNWRMALMGNFQSEITAQQLSCHEAIQQQFGRMGRESWTDGEVNNSAEWKQIRQLSREPWRRSVGHTRKTSAAPSKLKHPNGRQMTHDNGISHEMNNLSPRKRRRYHANPLIDFPLFKLHTSA